MKDVVIYYQGGTGGYFTFYYILASDSDILAKTPRNEKIYLGENKKLLDTVFTHSLRNQSTQRIGKNTRKAYSICTTQRKKIPNSGNFYFSTILFRKILPLIQLDML